jgi:hypothetical protein
LILRIEKKVMFDLLLAEVGASARLDETCKTRRPEFEPSFASPDEIVGRFNGPSDETDLSRYHSWKAEGGRAESPGRSTRCGQSNRKVKYQEEGNGKSKIKQPFDNPVPWPVDIVVDVHQGKCVKLVDPGFPHDGLQAPGNETEIDRARTTSRDHAEDVAV